MSTFTIREATPKDAEQIITHMVEMSSEPHNNILTSPGEFNVTIEEERDLLADYAASINSVWLVAESEGEIIGILNCRGGRRSANRHSASLGISIMKRWRNHGVGSALMQRMVEWARGTGIVTRLELDVFADNARAIHVYEKIGFKLEGRKVRAYYKDGKYVDALFMALLLD